MSGAASPENLALYHSGGNDYSYGSFVFELIKTVVTVSSRASSAPKKLSLLLGGAAFLRLLLVERWLSRTLPFWAVLFSHLFPCGWCCCARFSFLSGQRETGGDEEERTREGAEEEGAEGERAQKGEGKRTRVEVQLATGRRGGACLSRLAQKSTAG